MLDFYTDKIVKAKKDHKCSLCGQEIPAGEVYHRRSMKNDGFFFDLCYHDSCCRLLNEFCRIECVDEYTEDEVAEWLRKNACCDCCDCPYQDDCIANVFRCTNVIECILEEK